MVWCEPRMSSHDQLLCRIKQMEYVAPERNWPCKFWVADGVTVSTAWSRSYFEGRLHTIAEQSGQALQSWKQNDFKLIKGAKLRFAIRKSLKPEQLTDQQQILIRDWKIGKNTINSGPLVAYYERALADQRGQLNAFWKHLTSGVSDLHMIPQNTRAIVRSVVQQCPLETHQTAHLALFAPAVVEIMLDAEQV